MKRSPLPAAALVAGAVTLLSACGGAHQMSGSYAIDYRPHVPRSNVTPLANRREREAGRAAAALLGRVPLPPGAVRLPVPSPTDQLVASGLGVSTVTMTADRYSVWRVSGSGAAVIAYEKGHMLPRLRAAGLGSTPGGWQGDEFVGPSENGSPRWSVSVTVEPDGGQTRMRLDAGVAWIYPRLPGEVVPHGVHEVDIRGAGVDRRVTNPKQVERIVRWFDALNVTQPGPAVSCALVVDSLVTFGFHAANRAPLATAHVPSSAPTSNCDSIGFSIGGTRQTPLIDNVEPRGQYLVDRVQRLLGVTFR